MRAALIVAAVGLMMSPDSIAQTTPQTAAQPSDIVVLGKKKDERKRVREFARTLTPARMDEQIGRFVSPVCPAMLGLKLSQGELIIDRFRQVATAIGAPLGPKPCAANILIIAVPSKRIFIESMPRYSPGLVHGFPGNHIAALARSPSPVSAWQVAGLLDQNGLVVANAALDAGNPMTRVPTIVSTDISRVNKATQVGFTVSVLIVERQALANMSTRQFADYAALRTLAPIDPLSSSHASPRNPHSGLPADSILNLFDKDLTPADAPPSLTWWDFAFLQALYRMRMTSTATYQRGEIEAGMKRILASVPTDEL